MLSRIGLALVAVISWAAGPAAAQDASLAKKLNNPVAAMISLPFQVNYDHGYGTGGGERGYVNIRPVVPFSLGERWNLISRTILPVIWQDHLAERSGSGARDRSSWSRSPATTRSAATPEAPGRRRWRSGRPVPGLTGCALTTSGRSRATPTSARPSVQPFVAYTTPAAWTVSLNSETTYDWERRQASVPINAVLSRLVTIGDRPASFAGGLRYWAASPDGGPEGFGVRLAATLLFPK